MKIQTRIAYLRKAFLDTLAAAPALLTELHGLERRLNDLLVKLQGNRTREKRQEPASPSVNSRVQQVAGNQWRVTSPPTQTQRDAYRHAGTEFTELLVELRAMIRNDLTRLEEKLEAAGAPWTPGRLPDWEME